MVGRHTNLFLQVLIPLRQASCRAHDDAQLARTNPELSPQLLPPSN